MEEIVGSLLHIVGGALRWLLWDFLLDIVLFNIGRLFLLSVTLGQYPRGISVERDVEKISWTGVAVVLLIWLAIALYNNYG